MTIDTAVLGILCTVLLAMFGGIFAYGRLTQKVERNSDDLQSKAHKTELDRQEKAFAEYRADTQNKFKEFLDQNREEHTRIFQKLDNLSALVRNGGKPERT